MIKDVIQTIATAARKIVVNRAVLLVSFLLYGALLSVLYLLFTTREATDIQLLLTFTLPLLALFIFFTLQVLGVSYICQGVTPANLLKRSLKECWKLLLVSLPIILLGWLLIYTAGRIESQLPDGPGWRLTILTWARGFLLYFVLPLITIHLWIATERQDLKAVILGIGRSIVRAFSPRSMLVYLAVVAVFGAIAYFLFFTKTTVKSDWGELCLFGFRLALALIFSFLGWLLTLGSLAELAARGCANSPRKESR